MATRLSIPIRHLLKTKLFTLISVGGLTLSLVACFIIFKYVIYEVSFDDFHEHEKNIYRVITKKVNSGAEESLLATTFSAVGPTMKENIPEVIDFFRLKGHGGVISYEEKKLSGSKLFFADPSILKIFTFQFIEGNETDAFFSPYSAILSKSYAAKIFGRENPIGKTLVLDGIKQFVVNGVFKDFPENSHIKFDVVLSYESLVDWAGVDAEKSWSWSQFPTYVLLNKNASVEIVNNKLAGLAKHYNEKVNQKHTISFSLQPLRKIHLFSGSVGFDSNESGDITELYFLISVAGLIFVISLLNYINLSTTKIIARTVEIGIRKVLGDNNIQITYQFLYEWFILNTLPILLSVIVLIAFGKNILQYLSISKSILDDISLLDFLLFLFFFVIINVISSIYPFIFSLKLKVVDALINKTNVNFSSNWFKNALTVLQFSMSFILIALNLFVYKQLKYVRAQNLGFDIEQTLVLRTPKVVNYEVGYVASNRSFKEELIRYPFVKNVTFTSALPGNHIFQTAEISNRMDKSEYNIFKVMYVDNSFVEAFNLKVIHGNFFSQSTDLPNKTMVVNESAAKLLGFEDIESAVDKLIVMGDQEYRILGVLKNYHHLSLKENFEPIIYLQSEYLYSSIFIKLNVNELEEKVAMIKSKWSEFYPGNPFEFFFLDDHFNSKYSSDHKFAKITFSFTVLSILMSVLGLLGLSSAIIIGRTREIGIRKVLGASTFNVIYILSKNLLSLIAVSILIGFPLAYLIVFKWLENFSFRLPVNYFLFCLPGICLLIISILTISSYTYKAARVSPVKQIKT